MTTVAIKIVTWFAACSETGPTALKQEQILNKHSTRYHKVTKNNPKSPAQWTKQMLPSALRFNLGQGKVVTSTSL